jgi:iron complex outermembrane receptor protein
VEALGSFRRMRFNQNTGANAGVVYEGYDYLGQNTDVYSNGFWDTRSDSVVAELRAYAPDTARLRWTIGAFFFDEQQDAFLGQVNDGNFFGGGEFNMPGVTGRSLAGYADATFDVTPSLRVLGGVRVTRDEKTRFNGLWSLFTGWPGGNEELGDVRFGTEGFRYEGFGRNQYVLPDNYANLSPQEQATERVNMFLAGVESFGGRDNLPLFLCDENGFGEDGAALPVLEPNAVGSGWQCANGIAEGVNVDVLQMVPQNSSTNPTFFDWRAGVEYDLAKDNLLYATVSTGHKSGGFNDTSPGLQQGQLFNSSYEPEDVLALELGSKNLLAERKMRLNASAFAYLYNDYVFQTIVSVGEPDAVDENGDPLSAGTAVRQNAASATIYGLDVDLSYRLPLGLEAEVHALFMDARFGDETLVNDSRIGFGGDDNYVVDIAGNWLPRASPYTVNFALSQLIFSSIGAFDWVISGQTRGQHYMSVYNGDGQVLEPADGQPRAQTFIDGDGNEQLTAYGALTASDAAAQRLTDVVPTYTRFDVGAGWRHPDGRIAVSAYVNNALNLAYTTSVIATPNTNLRFYNPPRQAGVRFRVDW